MLRAVLYMKYRSFINSLKRALQRPVTYVYGIGGCLYAALVMYGFFQIAQGLKIESADGLVLVLSIATLVFTPMSFISYAKQRGLNFKSADVNFLFPAPVNPKMVLLVAQFRNWTSEIVLSLVMIPIGIFIFHVVWWRMLLYFLVSIIIKELLESAIIILLYGNERLSEKAIKWIGRIIYGLILLMIAYIACRVLIGGERIREALNVLNSPVIMAVPIVGWLISFYHLILTSATVLQIVFSVTYLVFTVVMVILAVRMRCTGEYYEKAMEYSDMIETAVKEQKKGKGVVRIQTNEEKAKSSKKLKKVAMEYKGSNAKALFYRQILEYKKTRFFIFGVYNLVYLAAGVVTTVLLVTSDDKENAMFFILGVCAYLTLLFNGLPGKWRVDLEYHYTFLLPDTTIKKLWYSTLVEHFRGLTNGVLIATPVLIVYGLNPIVYLCMIYMTAAIEAVKLYSNEIVNGVFNVGLGGILRQILQIAIQTFALGIAAVPGILLALKFGNAIGALVMCVLITGMVALLLVIGSHAFERIDLEDET